MINAPKITLAEDEGDIEAALLEYHALQPEPVDPKVEHTPRFRSFQQQYRNDYVALVHDCFTWPKDPNPSLHPASYQDELLANMTKVSRQCWRGPHGLGKTASAAWVVWSFALTLDGDEWKAITTASSWRQLTKYLWPEIRKWARRMRYDVIGRTKFDQNRELFLDKLRLETGEASSMASDQPELMEGGHEDNLLYIFDESKAIITATFDALEGAFSTPGNIKVLAISTPGEPSGRFYEIQTRKAGLEDWYDGVRGIVRHVTVEEAIAAGRISGAWVEQKRRQWGEDSAVFQNRVLGNFASSTEDTVIPLAWIEAAQTRWGDMMELEEKGEDPFGAFTCDGVDVARGGKDSSYRARRHGDHIKEIRHGNSRDTMILSGEVHNDIKDGQGYAVVDEIGVGGGVVDRLRELGDVIVAFHASAGTNATDRSEEFHFLNKRAHAYWCMRERLDPAYNPTMALPPDEELTGDLVAARWWVTSGGNIQVESKDDIKKRLGRSPDKGDSVMIGMYEEEESEIEFY